MRTKNEILKMLGECQSLSNKPEGAWYLEYAKLGALLDIRNVLNSLAETIQKIEIKTKNG